MIDKTYSSTSEGATIELGETFAKRLKPGDAVMLYGDIGAGKTNFIKGVCNYFRVDDIVNSPTFTFMNRYDGKFDGNDIPIYHIDLYRIKLISELDEIGYRECIYSSRSIKLVEWAEKANGIVPQSHFAVKITFDESAENNRTIQITQY